MKLFRFETTWLVAIFEAILPRSGTLDGVPGADRMPLRAFLDDFFEHAPPSSSIGVRLAAWAVQFLALFVVSGFRVFTAHGRDKQVAVLEALSASRIYYIRELPMLLKTIAFFGWEQSPDVQHALGVRNGRGERLDGQRENPLVEGGAQP